MVTGKVDLNCLDLKGRVNPQASRAGEFTHRERGADGRRTTDDGRPQTDDGRPPTDDGRPPTDDRRTVLHLRVRPTTGIPVHPPRPVHVVVASPTSLAAGVCHPASFRTLVPPTPSKTNRIVSSETGEDDRGNE